MSSTTNNPLRYPGGKYFLVNYIQKVLETNSISNCTFYEPYAGSAAVSLEMLFRRVAENIIIIEKDPLLFSFWKSVIFYSDDFCELIENLDVSLETWKRFLPYRQAETPLLYSTIELGLAGLFFNRTNYSGIISAKPIGGINQNSEYKIDCRFNKKTIINHIKRISGYQDQISVKWMDALTFLKGNFKFLHESNCFVYIDPPYYSQGKRLYRYYYTDKNHRDLANLMKKSRFPWLISYDDHPYINKIYFRQKNEIKLQKLYCDYSVRVHKRESELLISNLLIPPIEKGNLLTCNSGSN